MTNRIWRYVESVRGRCPALSLLLAAVITSILFYFSTPLFLNGVEQFPDFIGSYVAVTGVYKTGENRLFLFAFITLNAMAALLILIPTRTAPIKSGFGSLCALLTGLTYGLAFMKGSALFLAASCALLLLSFAKATLFSRTTLEQLGLVAINSLIVILLSKNFYNGGSFFLHCFIALALIAAAPVAPKMLQYLQLLSPLLLIRFMQFTFTHDSGSFVQNLSAPGALLCIAIILTLIGIGAAEIRRGQKLLSVTTASLAALLTFVTPATSAIHGDEYHTGEMLLPFQQIALLGQAPYSEFVPTQGLLGLTYGAVHYFLTPGNLQGFACTPTLVAAFFALAITLAVSWGSSPWLALLLAPLSLPSMDRFYLFTLALLLLTVPRIWYPLKRWLMVAAILCSLAFLWQPVTGVALGIAAVAFALWRVSAAGRNGQGKGLIKIIAPATVALLLCVAILPMKGAILFLLENGYTNTAAHGLQFLAAAPLNSSFPQYFNSELANRITWEGIRVGGWMLGAAFMLTLTITNITRVPTEERLRLLFFVTCCLISCILLEPYVIGRVDPPVTLSRTGALSLLLLGLFAPLLVGSLQSYSPLSRSTLVLAGFFFGVPVALRALPPDALLTVPTLKIPVPAEYQLFDGEREELPHLGKFFAPPDKIKAVQELRRAITTLAGETATFADLSNRISYYYLLNKRFPNLYASVAAVNERQQKRVISLLKTQPPEIVLIEPLIPFEAVSAALRSYRMAKWFVLNNYKAVKSGRFLFLLHPEIAINSNTEATTEWEDSWVTKNLNRLPLSWGNSYKRLAPQVEAQEIRESVDWSSSPLLANDPSNSLTITFNQPLEKVDFLAIELKVPDNRTLKGSLQWIGEDGSAGKKFSFVVQSGLHILPVGTSPKWLKQRIKSLHFSFPKRRGAGVQLSSIALLRLKD